MDAANFTKAAAAATGGQLPEALETALADVLQEQFTLGLKCGAMRREPARADCEQAGKALCTLVQLMLTMLPPTANHGTGGRS